MNSKRIACVGAGIIGQGWATVFSSRGLEVILQDRGEPILEKAAENIASDLMLLEEHSLLGRGGARAAIKRIKTTTNLAEAVCNADYIQESVPDDYELKKQVFRQMDTVAPDHAILASSASGLLMSEIQKVTTMPGRCVLVHPMLPVYLIPLVEIVGGDQTSPATVDKAYELMKDMGKSPVVLNREVPGYIVNRLQAALMREAIDLVDKGIASAEAVDKAFCVGIGLRDPFVGPFLRMHLAGNGIERFIDNFSESYENRWQTMETWTSISAPARQAIEQGTRAMEVVRAKTLQEIQVWRDEMLIKLLGIMGEGKL